MSEEFNRLLKKEKSKFENSTSAESRQFKIQNSKFNIAPSARGWGFKIRKLNIGWKPTIQKSKFKNQNSYSPGYSLPSPRRGEMERGFNYKTNENIFQRQRPRQPAAGIGWGTGSEEQPFRLPASGQEQDFAHDFL